MVKGRATPMMRVKRSFNRFFIDNPLCFIIRLDTLTIIVCI